MIAPVLKTGGPQGLGGSNPSPSARNKRRKKSVRTSVPIRLTRMWTQWSVRRKKEKNMNKKLIVAVIAVVATAFGAYARPHGPGFGPGPRYQHHHGGWGRGGRNVWPGVVGGVVGGLVGSAIYDSVRYPRYYGTTVVAPAPVVVQQPVVVQPAPVVVQQPVVQNVWVEGRYVDQVQANGTVVRVWQPGHYVQSTTTVVQ